MKIRINDLARELEVKSKQILDVLIKVGVTEKKTHSSSVEEDEAEKVRKYFRETGGAVSRSRGGGSGGDEFRPKIDLSKISKPGDALKAILARKEQPEETAAHVSPPPAPPKAIVNKPAAPRPAAAAPPVVPPRMVTPESVAQRHNFEAPRPPAAVIPPAPPLAAAPPAPPIPEPAASSSAIEHPPAQVPAAVSPSASETVKAPMSATAVVEAPPADAGSPVVEKPVASAAAPADSASATTAAPKSPAARPPLPGQPSGASHDCAADGTASGVHGSAATAAARAPAAVFGADGKSPRPGTWAADLPASPPRSIGGARRCAWRVRSSHGSRCASPVPSRRTPSDASYPQRSYARRPPSHGWRTSWDGSASRWPASSRRPVRRCRRSSASGRRSASRCTRRCACPPSRPALYGAARQAGRTDEGVHAAAAAFAQQ